MLQYIPIKSLKNKLIFYFLLITIIPSVALSYFYYKSSYLTLESNLTKTATNDLGYIGEIIDKQMRFAKQLSDWAFINPDLDLILTNQYAGFNYGSEVYRFRDLMEFQLRNTSVGSYVAAFLIVGNNQLDLRVGTEGAQVEKEQIQATPWFRQGMASRGKIDWFGLASNPARINNDPYILPVVRPVLNSDSDRQIGWQLIMFRPAIIADQLKNYEIAADETLMIIDAHGNAIYHSQETQTGQNLSGLPFVAQVSAQNQGGHFMMKIGGQLRTVSYGKIPLTGWSIIKVLSAQALNRQKRLLIRVTLLILLSSMVFTSVLTVYLTNNLSWRLKHLLSQTREIAAGNFGRNQLIEGEDELGVLGRAINEMAVNIEELLQREIQNEQDKRRLELDVLQNQVNPHFLYNTLNSIKLMATIQKADGIKAMVSALGRLLLNLSKNKAEKITLEEELALLDDYLYIQNIRYKGKIKPEYRIDSDAALHCKIVKFTLQPIVENAIFHGIEPKKDAGRIVIDIREADDGLVISIEDDGVGMTQAQIESVLGSAEPPVRGMSGIGVRNVAERIRLVYGPDFGLMITSVPGEYTRVALKIPKEP